MNIFERIDAEIHQFFTKISHKFQRLTGRTNFFLAKICLVVAAMSVLIAIANYWFPLLNRHTSPMSVFFLLLIVLYISIDKTRLEKAENSAYSDAKAKMPFILSSTLFIRLIFMVFVVIDFLYLYSVLAGVVPVKTSKIFEIIDRSFSTAILCYYYLIEVNPLPPGKGKVREWVESFANGTRKLAPVKSRN